jgi:hypothetical protein
METVTLHSEDFKQVHNTLCELRSLVERMTHSMIKIDEVQRIVEGFEQGLAHAYEQDRQAFQDKSEHYDVIKQQEGFRAIWSIYSVEELGEPHPYLDAERVIYRDHWGDLPTVEAIPGGTWIDLYHAADRCIRASGDEHHVYIEQFRPSKDDPKTLILSTGS